MKLISLTCSKCGATMEVDADRKECFCTFCGTKLMIADETININQQFIDEARLREAEVRMKELEYQHERELRAHDAEAQIARDKKNWKLAVLAYFAAIFLCSNVFRIGLGGFVVLGLIALILLKPKEEVTRQAFRQSTSSKSRSIALVFCLFLGIFGGHYFYTRRYGMGILYLLTGGLFFFGAFIDFFRIAFGSFTDADGRRLR